MGIRLGSFREPKWEELRHGVQLHMRPATSIEIEAAHAAAKARIKAAMDGADALRDLGMVTPDSDRLQDANYVLGLTRWVAATELAVQVVDDWKGFDAADGSPATLTPANLADAFLFESIQKDFEVRAYGRQWAAYSEGKE